MPAVSPKQQRLFAIAEHEPEKLYPENKALASLPHKTLHEFAATKYDRMKGVGGANAKRKTRPDAQNPYQT